MFNRGRGFGFGGFSLGNKKPSASETQLAPSPLQQHHGSGASGLPPPPKNRTHRAGAAIPPPSSLKPPSGTTKQGYAAMTAISQNAIAAYQGVPKKRPKNEEEYFEDDEEDSSRLEYIPAPGSPGGRGASKRNEAASDSGEDSDPLDAFMAGIEKQVKEGGHGSGKKKNVKDDKGVRDDIELEDDEESYYRYITENPHLHGQDEGSDGEIEYDEDGNPIAPPKSKYIDPLPPIDHSTITYEDFEKNFYTSHEEIARLKGAEIEALRGKLGVKVTGADPPKPVTSFGHFGFDETLLKVVRKSEYTQPTPIQAQGVPIILSGRDMIGIAKTGSGKTAAFLWPLLIHIMEQRPLQPGEGPIGLIMAPTRELSQQIYAEAKRFGKVYNIRVVCCYGGGSKWEQSKALEEGAEIVVGTPGRLIDLIKIKATNLQRVTFLVLDEADRMFDMGFEPQVRSICDHVRPDRQTTMFSATFKKKVERLARDVLSDPVRVVHGDVGEANQDVVQLVLVMANTPDTKFRWLTEHLVEFTSMGSVLIFVTRKDNSEEIAEKLRARDFDVLLLHGDMDQIERNKVITAFKKRDVSVMVATDVAARGLDIPHIRNVINYDVARDIDTHTHRVGRTGRAGEKGFAYTLVTDKDKEFAGHLVRNLEGANQEVPEKLYELAMQSAWFRKSRFKKGGGKQTNFGLGYKERPGLGTPQDGSGASKRLVKSIGYDAAPPPASATAPTAKSGPQSDRLSAMRLAFQAQYKSQFTSASVDTAWKVGGKCEPAPVTQSASSASKRERKKTRWE